MLHDAYTSNRAAEVLWMKKRREVWIRPEIPSDIVAVRAVQEAAFGRSDEANLVDALRNDGTAIFSLVAGEAERIVGHIVLSEMRAPFRALGLGPIAVLPERQHNGIGSKLILEALMRARADAWDGVFVVGNPSYYERFGFNAHLASGFQSPHAGPYLMALALRAKDLPAQTGSIEYALAFAALS